MEGNLSITVNGIERKMFFGNYALEQTIEHFGVSVSDIGELLNKKMLPAIRMFMYYGAEDRLWKDEKIEPDFTPRDMHEWIDQCGGTGGDLVMKVSKELFRCLGLKDEEPAQKKSSIKKK